MRSRVPFIIAGLCLLFFLLATAWLFIASKRSNTNASIFAMPDGTRVQVEGLTFGKKHTFIKGSPLLAKLHEHAPRGLKGLLPKQFSTTATMGEEQLLLWYNRYDPATDTYPNPNLDSFRVIDDHGCVFHVNSYGGGGGGPAYSVGTAHVQVFPRRQKTFKVSAQSLPVTNIVWTVENPFVTNPPAWTPEPLPATREQDGVQFTLERIRGHFYPTGNWFDPRFRIMHGDDDRTEWYRPRAELVDATGNRDYNRLCPYEPAWKVDVTFYKSHKAPFTSEQIWSIQNLVIPPSGHVISLTQTTRLADISVKLIALCGPGRFSFSNGVCVASNEWDSKIDRGSFSSSYSGGPNGRIELTFSQGEPSLLAEIDSIKRTDDLLLRFRDPDGHTFAAEFRGSANKTYRYDVKMPKGFAPQSPLDLEVIPQNPVRKEYLVEPPRPPAARATNGFGLR